MDSLIFMMFVAITAAALIMLAIITKLARKKSGLDHAYYQAHWKRVQQMASMGEHGRHMAIIEADKLLDHALKARHFHGETMADRLKTAGKNNNFGNIDAIWKAHKLRNRLAHESDVRLNQVMVTKTLQAVKTGLKDIGAF